MRAVKNRIFAWTAALGMVLPLFGFKCSFLDG